MKNLQWIIFLAVVSGIHVHGQSYLKEFGKIGQAEIDLKQYASDTTAEAVVLFDIGQSYFVRNGNTFAVAFERTTRIKILSESGIQWSEVEIPFYHKDNIYEKIEKIEAYTYNYANGKLIKTPFNVSQIYDEKLDENWSVRKFALPNVKKGSIIEYKYKIFSQYLFNLRDWEFQWRIPVVYSEYEVDMIPFYEYTYLLQGAKKFDYQKSYVNILSRQFGQVTFQTMVYKYIMEDVPAFKSEEYITSVNDYLIKMDFQLAKINYPDGSSLNVITTWDELTSSFIKNNDFGKYIKKSEKLSSKLIKEEDLVNKNDNDKFNFILDYVKNNFSWNKEINKYASKTPGKFAADKYGNSADINLFTIGMLNNAGIEAYPVLVSTRSHGKIKYDYPYKHFFNYVLILANLNGTEVLTDATETYLLNNRIPARCINDKGLIINKNNIAWVNLECTFPSEIETVTEINISDNLLRANITKSSTEYDAQYMRNNYTDDKEVLIEKLKSKNYQVDDSSVLIENQYDKSKLYVLKYSITAKPEVVHDKIYIPPFLNETITENPLKQKNRTYPVDMIYPEKRSFKTKILIPEGYQIDYLPHEERVNNQLFAMNYKITTNDKEVSVLFNYFFKKSVYPPDVYSDIRYYFKEIVKKGNEKIVFSKITE